MTDELSAEQSLHIPFPDRCGPGGRKSCGVTSGAVDAQKGSARFHPSLESGTLLLAERVSACVIPNSKLEFRELVQIHDRAVFRNEVRPSALLGNHGQC